MAKVTLLRTILTGIADLERAINKHLATHPKAPLLAALPYAGQISLAQLLAELGPILDRAGSADQAAAEAGATPVTRTSGKTSSVRFRMAANRNAPAKPCTASPATPATAHHGPPSSTPTPAANATPRPSASSAVPGCGSSGPAGIPTPPTTPPSTAPNNASPQPDLTQETETLRRSGKCSQCSMTCAPPTRRRPLDIYTSVRGP